jgi:integrase
MGAPEVSAFLEWLAMRQRISASTQNQALCALLFLYREVLRLDIGAIQQVPRARTPTRLPVVLSRDEVGRLLKALTGTDWIIVALLYGAGLRLQDCLGLRVKDVDFDLNQIVVRRGKGQKDRRTMLPALVKERLQSQLAGVRQQHERDLRQGVGRAVMPFALDRKYPAASTEWKWQFVFPAARICRDPQWGPPSRYHLHESVVQKAVARCRARRGHHEARRSSYHAPFICDSPPRRWLRHPDGAGIARTCGREHDDDLSARAQSGRARRSQSARSTVMLDDRNGNDGEGGRLRARRRRERCCGSPHASRVTTVCLFTRSGQELLASE